MPGFVSWDPGGLSPRGLLGVGGNFPQQPEGCRRKFPPKLWAGAPVHQDASQHPPALGGGDTRPTAPPSRAAGTPPITGHLCLAQCRGCQFSRDGWRAVSPVQEVDGPLGARPPRPPCQGGAPVEEVVRPGSRRETPYSLSGGGVGGERASQPGDYSPLLPPAGADKTVLTPNPPQLKTSSSWRLRIRDEGARVHSRDKHPQNSWGTPNSIRSSAPDEGNAQKV